MHPESFFANASIGSGCCVSGPVCFERRSCDVGKVGFWAGKGEGTALELLSSDWRLGTDLSISGSWRR